MSSCRTTADPDHLQSSTSACVSKSNKRPKYYLAGFNISVDAKDAPKAVFETAEVAVSYPNRSSQSLSIVKRSATLWTSESAMEIYTDSEQLTMSVTSFDPQSRRPFRATITIPTSSFKIEEQSMQLTLSVGSAALPLTMELHVVRLYDDFIFQASDFPTSLRAYAQQSFERYNSTGDPEAICEAASLGACCVSLIGTSAQDSLVSTLHLSGVYNVLAFEATMNLTYLRSAPDSLVRAIELFDDSDRGDMLSPMQNNLAISLVRRALCLGNPGDLDDAVQALIEASQRSCSTASAPLLTLRELRTRTGIIPMPACLALSGVGTSKGVYLENLHHALFYRFHIQQDPEDLIRAIASQAEASALSQDLDPLIASRRMSRLANTLILQYEISGDLQHLDRALPALEVSLSLTPNDDGDYPVRATDLASALVYRFNLTEDPQDINRAIDLYRASISSLSDCETELEIAKWNDELGCCFMRRFDRGADVADLDAAITAHKEGIRLTSDGDPTLPARRSNWGTAYMSRFERFGAVEDIDQAIELQQSAVDMSEEGESGLPTRLNNLGLSLMHRFDHKGDHADLELALTSQRRAVALSSDNDPDLPSFLHNLVTTLNSQLGESESLEGLDEAIKLQEKVIKLSPDDHPDLPTRLNNLGALFLRRSQRLTTDDDIDRAKATLLRATELTPHNHPDLPIWWNNLANAHDHDFRQRGDINTLHEAVAIQQKAIKLCPADHADLPKWWNNLGGLFILRFGYSGDQEDGDEAIHCHRKALELCSDDNKALKGTVLYNLSYDLLTRYERFPFDATSVKEAVECLETALFWIDEDHTDYHLILRLLAGGQASLSTITGDSSLGDDAILNLEKVTKVAPKEHVLYPSHLAELGQMLANRYEAIGNEGDWNKCTALFTESFQTSPVSHPDVAVHRNMFGNSFLCRYRRLSMQPELEAAISQYRLAATSKTGTWMVRLYAATEWAKYAAIISPELALEAYDVAVKLISVVAGLQFTIQRRHQHLIDTTAVSRSAAANALECGRPDKALEYLEHGRGLIWAQMTQLRTPIDALRDRSPALAERFMIISRLLENAGLHVTKPSAGVAGDWLDENMKLQDRSTAQAKHAMEWEELLVTIRAIPEFRDFLRPPSTATLIQRLPSEGYVVTINVHPARCDAIVLHKGCGEQPLHIPLPSFSFDAAERLYTRFRATLIEAGVTTRGDTLLGDEGGEQGRDASEDDGTRGVREARRKTKVQVEHAPLQVLRELWTHVVDPILKALDLSPSSDAKPPARIWWCTTGVLSFLPVHAAGIYKEKNQSVSDYVVSSYTPTISMLADRMSATTRKASEPPGILLLAQPNVPRMTKIPGTVVEMGLIEGQARQVGIQTASIGGDDVISPEDLMDKMRSYTCVHLACHATQDPHQPLSSGFYLNRGRLLLSTIIQGHLQSADLAFLSACQTGTGDAELSEEAVHLAAGMMAAGYRGVVAAMWSIQDRHGAQVADDFYRDLLTNSGDAVFDGSKAAFALHFALRKLRKKLDMSEDSFLAWTPYIHFGL